MRINSSTSLAALVFMLMLLIVCWLQLAGAPCYLSFSSRRDLASAPPTSDLSSEVLTDRAHNGEFPEQRASTADGMHNEKIDPEKQQVCIDILQQVASINMLRFRKTRLIRAGLESSPVKFDLSARLANELEILLKLPEADREKLAGVAAKIGDLGLLSLTPVEKTVWNGHANVHNLLLVAEIRLSKVDEEDFDRGINDETRETEEYRHAVSSLSLADAEKFERIAIAANDGTLSTVPIPELKWLCDHPRIAWGIRKQLTKLSYGNRSNSSIPDR